MTGDLGELLTYPFMQRALVAALLLGLVCPLLGSVVVIRRMAYFSDAVAHFALPGIAIALAFNWDMGLFLTFFCIAIALIIFWIKDHSPVATDALIGVFSSGAIAAGVVLMSNSDGGQAQVMGFLFGDILAVNNQDLGLLSLMTAAVGLFMVLTFRAQILINFHPDLAQVNQIPVERINYIFIFLLAWVVATAIKVVGALLITAFLVVPGAFARQNAQSFTQMLWIGPLIGVTGAVIGV